jgi:hypothetical protein
MALLEGVGMLSDTQVTRFIDRFLDRFILRFLEVSTVSWGFLGRFIDRFLDLHATQQERQVLRQKRKEPQSRDIISVTRRFYPESSEVSVSAKAISCY